MVEDWVLWAGAAPLLFLVVVGSSTSSSVAMIFAVFLALVVIGLLVVSSSHTNTTRAPPKPQQHNNTNPKKNNNREGDPFTAFEDRVQSHKFPRAARFLAWNGLPTHEAGTMVAGLHVSKSPHDWVDVCPKFEEEIAAKKLLFQHCMESVYCNDATSLPAQWEAFSMLVETLTTKYPNLFTVTHLPTQNTENDSNTENSNNSKPKTFACSDTTPLSFPLPAPTTAPPPNTHVPHIHIHVHETKDKFCTLEFANHPLLLASLAMQEDMCVMREDTAKTEDQKDFEGPSGKTHSLVAAVVCFSFNLPPKFQLTMGHIHTPVGGFHKHLARFTNRFFSSLRKTIMWRSNWGIRSYGSVIPSNLQSMLFEASRTPAFRAQDTVVVNVGNRGTWEQAEIVTVDPHAYNVKLEKNGEIVTVPHGLVGVCVPAGTCLCVGDEVVAKFSRDDAWYPGLVVKVHEAETGMLYDIRFDDGDFDPNLPQSRVQLMRPRKPTQNVSSSLSSSQQPGGASFSVGELVKAKQKDEHGESWINATVREVNSFAENQSLQQHQPQQQNVLQPAATYTVVCCDGSVKNNVPESQLMRNRNTEGEYVPEDKFIKVEFQTLRRLPISNYIFFSIRTYSCSLPSLQFAPESAAVLAEEIKRLDADFAVYKGLEDPLVREKLVTYLERIAKTTQ